MVEHLTLTTNTEGLSLSYPGILCLFYVSWSQYTCHGNFPTMGSPGHRSSEIRATWLIQFAQTQAKFRGWSRDYLRTCPCSPEKLKPQTQTPSPSWAKSKTFCRLARAQTHSGGARIFLVGTTQSSRSDNSRTTELASAGLLCPRLENRPRCLTQAEAPPRAWRQRQASPGMLRGRRRSNADERNFCENNLGSVQLRSRLGSAGVPLQPFFYCPPVNLSAPSPPARAPRDGRIHQPVGARRSRGRRRGSRCDSICRRLGHGQLHPRPVRLPGGPQAGRHGSGSGGAALQGRGPEPPATPAAALGPSGGDPAGNAHTSALGRSQSQRGPEVFMIPCIPRSPRRTHGNVFSLSPLRSDPVFPPHREEGHSPFFTIACWSSHGGMFPLSRSGHVSDGPPPHPGDSCW